MMTEFHVRESPVGAMVMLRRNDVAICFSHVAGKVTSINGSKQAQCGLRTVAREGLGLRGVGQPPLD